MRRVIVILSVWTFLFSACEKQEPEIVASESEAEYFPNSVDSYWKYQKYDHLTNTIDTITITITGDTIVSNDSYKIWEYDYGDRVERAYVLESNDSIIFYRFHFNWTSRLYITPFELGLGWNNSPFHPDTSYVSSIEDVVMDGRLYQDVVLIERSSESFNAFLTESVWIKPGIGLVKFEKEQYILGAQDHETWKLIETHIP